MTFWDLLSKLNPFVAMGYFSLILAVIHYGVKKLRLRRVGGVEFDSDTDEEETQSQRTSSLTSSASEELSTTITSIIRENMLLVDRGSRMSARHAVLKDVTILKNMMNEFENVLLEMEGDLKRTFTELLRSSSGGANGDPQYPYDSHLEYREFSRTLVEVRNEVMVMIRRFMRENHFIEKGDVEFRNYASQRAVYIASYYGSLLREHYMPLNITLKELDGELSEFFKQSFQTRIEECFHSIRKIAVENETQISRERDAFEKDLAAFYQSLPRRVFDAIHSDN